MDVLDQLHLAHWADASERLRLVNLAIGEIDQLREIIANYERDYSAGAGMAPIRKLGETTVEERSRSTGFSQRSRGYGSEDI